MTVQIHSHWQHETHRDDVTACVVRLMRPVPWPNHLGAFCGEIYDASGSVIHTTTERDAYADAAELIDRWLAEHPADPLDAALDACDGELDLVDP